MAVIWTESAQRIRVANQYNRSYINTAGNWSATNGRAGGPAVFGVLAANPADPAPSGEYVYGGVRVLVPGSTTDGIFAPQTTAAAAYNNSACQCCLMFNGTGLRFFRGDGTFGTLLATSTNVTFSASVLYYIAWEIRIHDTLGYFKAWVDGVEVTWSAANTGLDTRASSTVAGWGGFAVGHNYSWCDFYLLDSTQPHASDPASVILDARVDYVTPSGNGAVSGFTGSDGNSVDNYLLVDENTANDDTDYVEATAAGTKDAYALGNAPVAGATVVAVTSFYQGKKTDAGIAIARSGLRSGATDYMQPNNKGLSTSYTEGRHHWSHDPNNGAWSEALFNALEVIVEKV